MIQCKGCGGFLRFDIASQKLRCDYCRGEYDVSEFTDVRTADDNQMDVYSFTCPQCAGTIYGDRQDLTGFCSYCGSPVELAGRLTAIEKPAAAIPFSKTKEDCKEIFMKMVRRTPFLPGGYRDEAHIDSFRGIYMPYFSYNIGYSGDFTLRARGKEYRRGDYVYTELHNVHGHLEGGFSGFEHDASTAFDDSISEALGPYQTSGRVDFMPGYLSGFYADASDQLSAAHVQSALDTASGKVYGQVSKELKSVNKKIKLWGSGGDMNRFVTRQEGVKSMYPVWFMSYRNGDRVAYAAVNGQTGKITADLPLDYRKFFIFALITAVPIFLLLNSFALIMPAALLLIYSALTIVSGCMLHRQSVRILRHEIPDTFRKPKKKIPVVYLIMAATFMVMFAAIPLGLVFGAGSLPIIPCAVNIILTAGIAKNRKLLAAVGTMHKGTLSALVTSLACAAVAIIGVYKPVSDIWYYAGCLLILACVIWELMMCVFDHNLLATRKPVQFDKKGGDDNA